MANHFDAVIIGGGAAGLLCAGFAARRGMRVAVLEKNDRARPQGADHRQRPVQCHQQLRQQRFYPGGAGQRPVFVQRHRGFSTADTMAFFEGLGVPLKTERGNRVFPVSDQATDIVDALVGFAKDGGAKIFTGQAAKEVLAENGQVTGVLLESGEAIPCAGRSSPPAARATPLPAPPGMDTGGPSCWAIPSRPSSLL